MKRLCEILTVIALAFSPIAASALVSTSEEGKWPANWPKELEPLRKQARTVEIATGIQQNTYEIRFKNKAEFEKVWPVLLKLKTPGAPLTIYATNVPPPKAWGPSLKNDQPIVRIYAPSEGYTGKPEPEDRDVADFEKRIKEGKMLKAGPPWPAAIIGPKGELPEYVKMEAVDGKMQWVDANWEKESAKIREHGGFIHRARVDIELVADGNVIDVNALKLSKELNVRDTRVASPELSAEQRAAIAAEAQKTVSAFMRSDLDEKGNDIPERYWGEIIKKLKPVRLENDRVNVKIVLVEDGKTERGIYVNVPISSYAPRKEDFIEFESISEPEDKIFGGIYRYKLAKD